MTPLPPLWCHQPGLEKMEDKWCQIQHHYAAPSTSSSKHRGKFNLEFTTCICFRVSRFTVQADIISPYPCHIAISTICYIAPHLDILILDIQNWDSHSNFDANLRQIMLLKTTSPVPRIDPFGLLRRNNSGFQRSKPSKGIPVRC